MKSKKVKKIKQTTSPLIRVTPEEAVQFIESMWQLQADKDLPTKLISLRIPENILNALKIKAKSEGKKYQSLMIQFIRDGLKA